MCHLLGVSASGYYAWSRRTDAARERADATLLDTIRVIHARSKGTYGAPRIHAELRESGVRVGRRRIARLMREAGLRGETRRRWPKTTIREKRARPAPDLVQRQFHADAPDRLWVGDITYIPTATGFLYLAVVIDVWSRRVVGWAMENHIRTGLVLAALQMALATRRPDRVIFHSDQGCQYTAEEFEKACKAAAVDQSMGSVGDCYDNALAESYFATLECELLSRYRFVNQEHAQMVVFDFIEGWYNPHRRHSAIGNRSPMAFERLHWNLDRKGVA